MNTTLAMIVSVILITIIVAVILVARRPKKLNIELFTAEWKAVQGLCKDKDAWPIAISESDRLLHKALKKRRFKGKSMGERMVSAQRVMSNNDSMWLAHNFYKKLETAPDYKLKEAEVKAALIGFRQALKDLGALE